MKKFSQVNQKINLYWYKSSYKSGSINACNSHSHYSFALLAISRLLGKFVSPQSFILIKTVLKNLSMHQNQQFITNNQRIDEFFFFFSALLISMTMMFVCVVTIGTFVMAPAELGEPARICVALHWGADLAQWEGRGGDRLWLERQQPQHECQEGIIQCEWRKRGEHEVIKHKLQTTNF